MEWLARLLLAFAVFGVIVFDAVAIATNYFTLDGTANDIAVELSREMSASSAQVVDAPFIARAKKLVRAAGARLVRMRIDEEGVLHLRITRSAKTLVVRRIDPISRWGRAVAEGQAGTT